MLDVLKTIERRRKGIENFFRYHVANGMAEGFNNVVGTIAIPGVERDHQGPLA